MAGRPRKPTKLKLLQGTAQPCRTNKNEPKLKASTPHIPEEIPGPAEKAWRRLVKIIGPMKIMTRADAIALELAARAFADVIETGKVIEEKGYTYVAKAVKGTNADGNPVLTVVMRRRPEVEIANDAWRRLEKMLSHFGLSPSSRSKVSVIGNLKEDNPFDQF